MCATHVRGPAHARAVPPTHAKTRPTRRVKRPRITNAGAPALTRFVGVWPLGKNRRGATHAHPAAHSPLRRPITSPRPHAPHPAAPLRTPRNASVERTQERGTGAVHYWAVCRPCSTNRCGVACSFLTQFSVARRSGGPATPSNSQKKRCCRRRAV